MACLRIGVYEETGKLIGQRVLPMDGLQAGYRHISLRTEGNIPLSLPTLFCHIVLRTYVPDGLGDFVDALNNPKEFLTKEEKRLKQLQEKLGIDEKDIVPLDKGSKKTNSMHGAASSGVLEKEAGGLNKRSQTIGGEGNATGGTAAASSNRREEPQFERITRESLKVMKGFQKLLKKQAKEKETLKKKQNKERALMQKQHSAIIDKMNANNCKQQAGGTSVVSVSTAYVNTSNLNSTNASSSTTLVANGQLVSPNTPSTSTANNNANFVFTESIAAAADDNNNESSFKTKVSQHIY